MTSASHHSWRGRRYRRLQHPVRHQPEHRTHHRHRNEPACVPFLRSASKATGFPIAKIATKLALGYTLDEIQNDITQSTPASFEPTIDYVVTKVPRFAFEKFPGADPTLTTSMKSVGEAMALAGNFQESLGKAMRSIDKRHMGFNWDGDKPDVQEVEQLLEAIKVPTEHRYLQIQRAVGSATEQQIFDATKIDRGSSASLYSSTRPPLKSRKRAS